MLTQKRRIDEGTGMNRVHSYDAMLTVEPGGYFRAKYEAVFAA